MITKTKYVQVTHRVHIITDGPPERGAAFYDRKGNLVLITNGEYTVEGRLSNLFEWRPINKDGTLGRSSSGYWQWGHTGPKRTTNHRRKRK